MPTHATPSDLKLYARLLGFVVPYWRVFLAALAAMIVLAATAPVIAALLQPVLDGAFIARDPDAIRRVPLLIIAVFTVRAVASYVSVVSLHWVANRVVMDLRAALFGKLLSFPSSYHDSHTTGSVISKFTYDVTQIKQASTEAVTVLFRDSLYVAGLLAWMFWINWQMSVIAVVSGPFIAWVVVRVRGRLRSMNRRVQESMGDIHHALGEVIHGHRIVKLFGGAQQEQERFGAIINANRRFSMKAVVAAAASSPGVELITAVALALLIWIAGRQAVAGEMSVGYFASFFGAVALLLPPLKRLVRINEIIQRGLAACESVFAFLDEPPEEEGADTAAGVPGGDVRIEALEFGYANGAAPALSGVGLHIRSGETVAVVGASGSGKTTLAHLLPRFYDVPRGTIFIGVQDIATLPLSSLRAAISLVSQDIVLFNDTVRNNIAYGARRGATDAEIAAAADAANATGFIRALPQGFDTPIGERGSRLSGGQRQRIALARALLKDAPILILDEATSALDAESEREIQAALEKIRGRRTVIIIAHRLSTIESADRIIVLDRGRVVQAGTHAELIGDQGTYARLHQRSG
ncbi:MAG TPA: lipid A export permease/ATP-binding protein MsbA [Gammaproteobacteria bacterium]